MQHHFDVDVAVAVGVIPAVMLNHFQFWIVKNEANEQNFFEGEYWTYNSLSAMKKIFPYLTSSQLRTNLNKLIEEGYLKTGNFSKDPRDRTLWYTFTEKGRCIMQNSQSHLPNLANECAKNSKCIYTDNNTDNNTVNNNNPIIPFSEIQEKYNSICKSLPHCQLMNDKRKRAIKACLRDFKLEQLYEAFRIAERTPFLKGDNNRGWKADIDFLTNKNNVAKILEGSYQGNAKGSVPKSKWVAPDYDPSFETFTERIEDIEDD